MPAIRSFFSATLMAACLAQVMAGGEGGGQGGWGGEGGQGGGRFDGGGRGGEGDNKDYNQYQTSQWQDWQPSHVQPPPVAACEPTFVTKNVEVTKMVDVTKTVEKAVTVTVTYTQQGEKQISTVIKDGGKATITESKTITVTAAAPCTSVATAVVTQWQNAPPGCWCGGGPPPPVMGQWPWPMGDAPVHTTNIPNFVPGLSSIPAAEAVKTGVTVAGPAPAPAPTGPPGPPGAGFGGSTSTGTITSGSSSVPSSNNAQPIETGGLAPNRPVAPPAPVMSSSSTTSAASSASTSASSSSSATTSSKPSSTIVSPPPAGPPPAAGGPPPPPSTTTASTTTRSTTTTSSSLATAAALETSGPELLPVGPAGSGDKPEQPPLPSDNSSAPGGFPAGSFRTLDPATLTALAGSHTLGIGRREPQPTLLM